MMNRLIFMLCLALTGLSQGGNYAQAQATTSETTRAEVERFYPADERFGIKPAFGLNQYNDDQGTRSNRASYGIQTEYNLASAIGMDFNHWFLGPQSGFMFSHLGNADSDFFGSSQNNTGSGGANMFIIPADIKVGYSPVQWMRISAHGGGNVIYRSIASAIRLDDTDLNWRLIPNVGADLDLSISKNVALTLRPDWTLSTSQSMFSATAALGIALG